MTLLTNHTQTFVFKYFYHDQIMNILNTDMNYIITKYILYIMLYQKKIY